MLILTCNELGARMILTQNAGGGYTLRYDTVRHLVISILNCKRFYEILFLLLFVLCIFVRTFTAKLDCDNADLEEKKFCCMDWVFCIAVTIAASTFFSLFPMKNITLFNDSSIFLYIGERMHQGFVPYKDLFDHKGIVLYFIEYLGLALVPNSYAGVWLIEVVCMFATSVFLLKLGRLFTKDRMVLYLSVFMVCIVCGNHLYEGGNLSEEYALPWIAMAVYIFQKYLKENAYRKREVVLLGIGFMMVLMLRANMTAVWITFLPIVLLSLIYHHKWRDVAVCAMCFLFGMLVVGLPILGYCLCTDSLKDMVTYYWKFNLNYVEDSRTFYQLCLCSVGLLKLLFPASVAFVLSVVPYRKERAYLFNLLYGVISLGLAVMSGRPYAHYGMILMPALVIPIVYVISSFYRWTDKLVCLADGKKRFCKKSLKKYVYLFMFFCDICFILLNCLSFMLRRQPQPDAVVSYLEDCTTREDDVLILGNHVNYYLESDRFTKNKFFNQIPPINVSNQLFEEFLREFSEHPSDAILVFGEKETQLKLDSNLGTVYRMLEQDYQNGMLDCEVYDDFYVYRRQKE